MRLIPRPHGAVESTPELADDLLPLYLQRFDRAQTRRAYAADLRDFFGTSTVSLDLASGVTFVTINAYLARLEAASLKPTTIKRRVAALRGFFEWLVALGALPRNPASRQVLRRVRGVRRRDQAIVFLSAQEATRLIEAAGEGSARSALRDRVLLLTLLHCVLRRSEAAAMDVSHIRPLGHYWVLDLPVTKGGADQYVKIPAHVVEEIVHLRQVEGIVDGPLWRSVSNRNNGERLTPHSIYRIVKSAAQRAGLSSRIGAHTLRHTGCTLAIEAGASLQQVQSHARHKNIETTMVYIHQRDRLRDSAADYIHLKK